MKKARRIMSLLLAVVLLTANVMPVFAAPKQQVMPRWTHVVLIVSDMQVSWLGVATVDVTGQAYTSSEADSVEVIVDLQRKKVGVPGGSFETETTFTNKTNTKITQVYEKYAISKGYEYQLAIKVKAYKGSKLLETATDTYYYGIYN